MKKITFLLVLFSALSLHARTIDISAAYSGSKQFDKAQASATMALSLNTLAGLEAKMTNERVFKDPVYALAVPFALELDMMRFSFRPFYYFKNKNHSNGLPDSYAFGLNGQIRITLNKDEVNETYSHAFLGASFARQQGSVIYNDAHTADRYYSQAAYTLGLSQTLYNAFGFDLEGSVFQYPDGASNVTSLYSVLDQQDLARTQTLDVVHQLAKYTVGARMTRMWADNGSSAYVSYRFGEYHTADSEHSVMGGISFKVTQRITAEAAYNHLCTVHNQNKRDIGYVRLSTFF